MSESVRTSEHDLVIATDRGGSSDPTASELFHNGDGDAFVDIYVDGHRETHPVLSEAFRQWLRLKAFEHTGKAPATAELKRQIELLQAEAVQPGSPEREVHLRAAFVDGRVYIDLAENSWSSIEIGADGRRIIQSPPVRFIRTPGMLSLPIPQTGGSIETLRALVNVHDDGDFVLLVAWLLNALCNKGRHPLLVLSGGEGAAKSTLGEILSALIDPSCAPVGGLPRTERELATQARQRYFLNFGNVSALSIQMSDALCRLVTSANARPIILDGINDVVTRPDLADRSLFVTCDAITEERRRSEGLLWADFENAHAQIFGLLLDALSHGLRVLPETRLERLPRMADFAIWATACEGAFWPKGTFSAAYRSNADEAVEKMIGSDLLASAVRQLAAKRKVWTGTASELDSYLRAITGNVDATPQGWPADPARVATRLRQLAPSLNKVGIEVTFTKSGHSRTRLITISAKTVGPDAPKSDEVPPPTQSNSPSAPSAASTTGQEEGEAVAVAKDDPSLATATEAALEPVDSIEQPSNADGADGDNKDDHADQNGNGDGTRRSERFDVSNVTVGGRSVPVYRPRKRGKAKPGASVGTS